MRVRVRVRVKVEVRVRVEARARGSHLVRVDVGDGAYHGKAGGTPCGTHAAHLVGVRVRG